MTVLTGLVGAAIALAQTDNVQQSAQWQRSRNTASSPHTGTAKTVPTSIAATTSQSDDASLDEAVRWERAKDRAAKRQEQMESVTASKAKKK
jgi:hypothetical protein